MRERLAFIFVMLTFGSIGLFVRNIQLSSSEIALFRAMIGSLVILFITLLWRKKTSFWVDRKNGVLLFVSGGAMGFNWIFLFEAYRFTTIANATLSYYFAPVIVMLLAPFVLKEKWTLQKGIAIVTALTGLFFVVNPETGDASTYQHLVGVGYGLMAAVLYASVILINQFIKEMNGFQRTVVQLVVASIVLTPYVYVTEGFSLEGFEARSVLLLIVLGAFHTGVAYFIYFSILPRLSAQTVSVLSYIDPISAVFFSALFLGEKMTLLQILGGILILGSTFISERKPRMQVDQN